MTVPQASLSPLYRADGSATFTQAGYRVIAGVNGPIEVQRRDELPDEAAIEVNVRPAVGVGGPRERHIETLIHSTLRHVILTHLFPRSLVQLTLQILEIPADEGDLRSSMHTHLLAPLLNAATLALLSARIPMQTTPTAALIAISPESRPTSPKLIPSPTPAQIQVAASLHALCFSLFGDLLLCDSTGSFTIDEFDAVTSAAKLACLGSEQVADDDVAMKDGPHTGAEISDDDDDDVAGGVRLDADMDVDGAVATRQVQKGSGDDGSVLAAIRAAVEAQARKDGRWKKAS